MNEIQYKNKKVNISKLKNAGFIQNGDKFEYTRKILDGELELYVCIDSGAVIRTKITDTSCGEEYVLHLIDSAIGAYVGRVREIHKAFLDWIYNHCLENEVCISGQVKAIISYIYESFGESPKYPFGEETIVMRREDNDKWYALFMKIPAKKIGLEADEIIDVVNLKMKPEEVERVVDGKHYFAAYHMNKKHWVTIPLDTAIPTDELILRIDDSRRLVK